MLGEMKKKYYCYLWILPFFILFFIFQLYPMIYGFFLSLTRWNGFDPTPTIIGFENYLTLAKDRIFWETLWNTVLIWLMIVPLRAFLSLLIASIINSPEIKGKGIYSFFLLLPNITAVVVVAVIFRILLATNGGTINNLLGIIGIAPVKWLESSEFSKISIAIMQTWKATGYFTIIMLAGLQKIPKEIYEAADIDGASKTKRFFRITAPLVKDVTFFVVLISTIFVFQNVGATMILTNGGPGHSSTNLILYIYNNAFQYSKIGYASSMSYILFMILLFISYFSVKFNREKM